MEHFDVLIVGAGLSGVGAGWRLKKLCPQLSFAIFEAREAIGGTWDLFRYPGVRSDSDMYTLGFDFRPWEEAKAIADGPAILAYVRDTARESGVDRAVRHGRKVTAAAWDSVAARWTVTWEDADGGLGGKVTCGFLHMCAGYYDYAKGHRPHFTGEEDFAGRLVHPQFWPEDLDWAGKQVVVIGSGATAMTLVPQMAREAGKVTMVQRSPTYVVARPSQDAFALGLRRRLPARLAYAIVRWRNVLMQLWFYRLTRREPAKVKQALIDMVRAELGPDYDIATHFTPRYNPWDQRLCLVPDSDLFEAIRAGKAAVATGEIEAITAGAVRLKSGQSIDADIIVTATGLEMQLMGGLEVSVDGARVDLPSSFSYKGMMYSGVPNLSSSFGYTNASWTLKADLTSGYLCRLLNHMRRRGYAECRPIAADPHMAGEPWLSFSSGYVRRAIDRLPRQGAKVPWRVHQNYALDVLAFRFGRLEDGVMRFARIPAPAPAASPALAMAAE
jgi:cation diffusion facilitator CzcD-associated flavoprotein CzcO